MKYLFLLFLLLSVICFGQQAKRSGKGNSGHSGQNAQLTEALSIKERAESHYFAHQYDSAAYHYDKALGILKNLNKQDLLTADYAELARRYAKVKNYPRAIECYNKVIFCTPKNGERRVLMAALNQLAALYERTNNLHKALGYLRQAYDIGDSLNFAQKTQQNSPEIYSSKFMGDVMGSFSQKTVSEQDLLKTIETKRNLNDTLAMAINYFNLGILYKGKRMFPESAEALSNCISFANRINYTEMESSAVNEMADLYERRGDFKKSLAYLKKRMVLSRPEHTRNSKTVDELQTKYEIIQREDQFLQQQFEITKRNYWMVGIAVVILLTFVIGFIYYKQMQLKQRNTAMQAIIDTEESERKRIAQDLHDSVSQTMSAAKINLRVIGTELLFADEEQRERFEKVIQLVDDGFREVRTISHNMMPWALNQTGLAQVIKQFIGNIENNTITVNFFSKGFDEPLDATTEIILYRVLQESVNNVMKHAGANRLDISLIRDEENISLTIEDNGIGFDTSNPDIFKGMGMSNMFSRVKFLNGKVEFDSQAGKGTLVSIYIPFLSKNRL